MATLDLEKCLKTTISKLQQVLKKSTSPRVTESVEHELTHVLSKALLALSPDREAQGHLYQGLLCFFYTKDDVTTETWAVDRVRVLGVLEALYAKQFNPHWATALWRRTADWLFLANQYDELSNDVYGYRYELDVYYHLAEDQRWAYRKKKQQNSTNDRITQLLERISKAENFDTAYQEQDNLLKARQAYYNLLLRRVAPWFYRTQQTLQTVYRYPGWLLNAIGGPLALCLLLLVGYPFLFAIVLAVVHFTVTSLTDAVIRRVSGASFERLREGADLQQLTSDELSQALAYSRWQGRLGRLKSLLTLHKEGKELSTLYPLLLWSSTQAAELLDKKVESAFFQHLYPNQQGSEADQKREVKKWLEGALQQLKGDSKQQTQAHLRALTKILIKHKLASNETFDGLAWMTSLHALWRVLWAWPQTTKQRVLFVFSFPLRLAGVFSLALLKTLAVLYVGLLKSLYQGILLSGAPLVSLVLTVLNMPLHGFDLMRWLWQHPADVPAALVRGLVWPLKQIVAFPGSTVFVISVGALAAALSFASVGGAVIEGIPLFALSAAVALLLSTLLQAVMPLGSRSQAVMSVGMLAIAVVLTGLSMQAAAPIVAWSFPWSLPWSWVPTVDPVLSWTLATAAALAVGLSTVLPGVWMKLAVFCEDLQFYYQTVPVDTAPSSGDATAMRDLEEPAEEPGGSAADYQALYTENPQTTLLASPSSVSVRALPQEGTPSLTFAEIG